MSINFNNTFDPHKSSFDKGSWNLFITLMTVVSHEKTTWHKDEFNPETALLIMLSPFKNGHDRCYSCDI